MAAAFVSGAPLLIPQLSGAESDPDVIAVREASVAAATRLADEASEWVIIGAAPDGSAGAERSGTFAGYGADVAVSLTPGAADGYADPSWPLPLLIGGWLRGQVAPGIAAQAITVDPAAAPEHCAELGQGLRQLLDDVAGAVGLLVVADGAITLTAKAPGGFHEDSQRWQDELTAALGGDRDARSHVARWPADDVAAARIDGRAVYQVALAALGDRWDAETRYAAAPFGVGYTVANWSRPA